MRYFVVGVILSLDKLFFLSLRGGGDGKTNHKKGVGDAKRDLQKSMFNLYHDSHSLGNWDEYIKFQPKSLCQCPGPNIWDDDTRDGDPG